MTAWTWTQSQSEITDTVPSTSLCTNREDASLGTGLSSGNNETKTVIN